MKCRRVCREKYLSFPRCLHSLPARRALLLFRGCIVSVKNAWYTFPSYFIAGLLDLPAVFFLYLPPPSHPRSDFDPWWTKDREQNESDPIPANCTACAQKLPLKVMLLEDAPKEFERLHPLVIKVS